jgi:outer membrane protein
VQQVAEVFKNRFVRNGWRALVAAGVLAIAATGTATRGETLADALVSAYNSSGLLEQNRALLRAADEDVATTAALLKPILNYFADVTRDFGDNRTTTSLGIPVNRDLGATNASAGLIAELLLYDGGATALSRDSAKEAVLATRQQLIGIEQGVLFRAASAYLTVTALRQFVALRENNLRLVEQELRAAQDRFEVGEVTRTDVAQAEASFAESQSGLAEARGDLLQAVEEYRAAVGKTPGTLAPPPPLPRLNRSVEEARDLAVRTHPDLRAAQHQVAAAELNILSAEALILPRVTATSRLSLIEDLGSSDFTRSGSIGIELNGPIYQGGSIDSSIRRAIAVRDSQRGNLLEVQRRISQNVGNSYAQLSSQRASLAASEQRIEASRIAFNGVREEAALGARTTLDVLDAEQDLLDAETSRISAEANVYIAAFGVLQSTGRLTAEQLNLGVQTYDPTAYYNLVKDAPTARSKQGQQLDKVLKSLQKQ